MSESEKNETIVLGKKRSRLGSLRARLRPVGGLLFVLAVAVFITRAFLHSPLRSWVPLGFAAILVALATRFGALVGVLGAVLATTVFAYFLYPPLGSLHVEEASARENLAWMLLSAISLSFLLSRPKDRTHK